jgi:Putative metal-binding motif/RTX calcium-binding nonapeptide repeat (4 copies)
MLTRVVMAVLALLTIGAQPTFGAATISRSDNSTLLYDGEAADTPRDSVSLLLVNSGTQVKFEMGFSVQRATITPQTPCVFENQTASDPDVLCPRSGIARIVLDLKGGDDFLDADPFGSVFDIPVVVDAGGGADTIFGSAGADVIRGGPGGDLLSGFGGADDLTGGTGFDRVSYSGATPVRVSIDDVADDGSAGGAEGDNVHTDVEDLTGSQGNDTLIGSAAGNIIDGRSGNDTIEGGGGTDELILDEGDDTARARDGEDDRVRCGDGTDTVIADDIDEPGDCEDVQASGELVRDLDKDGVSKPDDCKDDDPAIRPGAVDTPDDGIDQDCDGADAQRRDLDGDGVARPFDCNDTDPAIRPGAKEVFGNAVDEDCSGRADPLQTILTPVLSTFIAGEPFTKVRRLLVKDLEPGMRVEALCTGRGCPFARRVLPLPRKGTRIDLRSALKLRRVRKAPTIDVRILREDSVGLVTRFRFRRGKVPRIDVLCMAPSDAAPRKC